VLRLVEDDTAALRSKMRTAGLLDFHLPSGTGRLYFGGVPFRKITIVGVGLLGGSIGIAARQRRLALEVAGYARRETSLVECEKAGAADYVTTDLLAAVSGADVIIMCTPLAQMRGLVERMLPAVQRRAIVTDVGSAKAGIVAAIEPLVRKRGAYFVGSHPMAGAEKAGVSAARGDLFENAMCVVTPTKRTSPAALRKVEKFWRDLDARVLRLPPQVHDLLVSRSSHLPHIAATALARVILDPDGPVEQALLCANGFRDTTRIASGSPEMWRDIALENRRNLDRAMSGFVRELRRFQSALRKADGDFISSFLTEAKQRRDAWCARCASPSPE
jgi:prephenate dehydrogenase